MLLSVISFKPGLRVIEMKCFNHQDRDSVAVCLTCGKGLCRECARESGGGISCSPQCTAARHDNKILFTELDAHLKNSRRSNILSGLFSLAMGILFVYFSDLGSGFIYDFVFLLGVGFAVYGILALLVLMLIFYRNRRQL